MGVICANNCNRDENKQITDHIKNKIQYQFQLGTFCLVDVIMGHYSSHHSDTLLVLCEFQYINYCDPLHDYNNDPNKTKDIITNLHKTLYKPVVTKLCPYKKMQLCCVDEYRTQQMQEYQQQFRNVVREVMNTTKEMALELQNTIEGISVLPNQLLLRTLLDQLKQSQSMFKLQLLGVQKKMVNLYVFQLLKTEGCILVEQKAE